MVQLDLNPDEQNELVEVLRAALSELRMEISATDSPDYRDGLKDRRHMLHKVLAALGAPVPEAPPPLP